MDSSKQGVDVLVIVFIIACRFFFDVLLNRFRGCLRYLFGGGFHFGLVLSKQVVAVAVVSEQVVAVIIVSEQVIAAVVGKQVVAIVFGGLGFVFDSTGCCLLYTSPSPRDKRQSRMPSST